MSNLVHNRLTTIALAQWDELTREQSGIIWSIYQTPVEQLTPGTVTAARGVLQRLLLERSVLHPLKVCMSRRETYAENLPIILEGSSSKVRESPRAEDRIAMAPSPRGVARTDAGSRGNRARRARGPTAGGHRWPGEGAQDPCRPGHGHRDRHRHQFSTMTAGSVTGRGGWDSTRANRGPTRCCISPMYFRATKDGTVTRGVQQLRRAVRGQSLLENQAAGLVRQAIGQSAAARDPATQLEVLFSDPLLLCLRSVAKDVANSALLGDVLMEANRAVLSEGCTPIFLHHPSGEKARQLSSRAWEPLELTDLAYPGITNFARQWLTITAPRNTTRRIATTNFGSTSAAPACKPVVSSASP